MNQTTDNEKIFTEEPENELWKSLLQYSYKANIERYFDENNVAFSNTDDSLEVLSNSIAGALQQADEYFKASRIASLQVEPLLLYYGTTNLLYALCILTTGRIPCINNHGLHIKLTKNHKYIADTSLKFDHLSDGGIHQFAAGLGISIDLCKCSKWFLFDFFDSIAEIRDDFERCYRTRQSRIIPLYVINTPDGIAEKVFINDDTASVLSDIVDGFSNSYLKPQRVESRDDQAYYVLRHKMNGIDIQQVAYSGQPYLQVAHREGNSLITVPKELNMYISLFALGSICRYHPEIWNPFVTQDSTGERLLIEKLLYYSRRLLPNIVLNRIQNKQISFVSDKYAPEDRIHLVGEHEVKEIINNELRKRIKREQAESIISRRRR